MSLEEIAQPDYWEWQRKLARVFLTASPRPQPFALFVDEDEAARLWPADSRPAESLAAAVAARLDWPAADLFRPITEVAARWELGRKQGPPPTLPVLAVTVLAASRMQRDADASSSAYFLRLAQVLRPDARGAHVQELRQKLSSGFGPVVSMWRSLDAWVDERSSTLGVSTIRGDHHLKRIGYPLSQALVRSSDRLRLTAFFDAAQVQVRGLPEPAALLQYLRIWASRPRGLSQSLRHALTDAGCDEILGSYLSRLAASWDGAVLTVEGRRRLDLRVVLDLDDLVARWVIPVARGIDQETLTTAAGAPVVIQRPEIGSLYELDGHLPAVTDGLQHGFKLTARSCSAAVEHSQILAFREDADAGGWMSTPSVQPFEEHLLAAVPPLRGEIEAALSEAAEPGWRALPQRPSTAVLPGWIIYRSVRFTDATALERALRRVSPALVSALRPDTSLRPVLTNGLPLARHLGSGHYLAGGEPDLVLPVGVEPRHVAASLDGRSQAPPFLATGFPIELRRHGPLAPGRHELLVDGDRLQFFIHECTAAGRRPSPAPPLAWRGTSGYRRLGHADGDTAGICGAVAPGGCPDPLLVRRGSTAWLISRDGRASVRTAPDPAPPLPGRAMPAPYYFEVSPEPAHVWLVETRGGRPRPPLLLRWQEPYFAAIDDASTGLWRLLETGSEPEDRLWQLYLRAWRRWSA